MEPGGGPPREGRAAALAAWRWPMVAVVVAVLAFLAWQQACWTARESSHRMAESVRAAGEAAGDVASRFRSGTITTTFRSEAPRLLPGGPRLEVVALRTTETLTRRDERRAVFDLVPLGATEAQIRVPVTYRWVVDLRDPWQLDVRDGLVVVHAPELRPTLPPAIHTDGLEKRSSSGWLRFDERQQLEALERSLTPRLGARASHPELLALVRDPARRNVAEFVREWLVREGQWGGTAFRGVVVLFPGEELTDVPQPSLTAPPAG